MPVGTEPPQNTEFGKGVKPKKKKTRGKVRGLRGGKKRGNKGEPAAGDILLGPNRTNLLMWHQKERGEKSQKKLKVVEKKKGKAGNILQTAGNTPGVGIKH